MRLATEPKADLELAMSLGLAEDEFDRLCGLLGRGPTHTELGVTSAMWSEHCSYKSSKIYLREFPTEGPHVVQGPGENAGIVDVGDGWVAVFKMESHNHPSFIEPYQGAATGVGGILRDIFTMGARPVACMDSLRFGEIGAPRMRYLVDGVVRGIGGYGNCVGIPTVGGETGFHRSYNGNILVNAFALGLARKEEIFSSEAEGVGNPILYVGSRTGRDGIHGATMASESFDSESEAKRPTVQVGDPFTEKVLLEACLEAMRTDSVVAFQDMGAAGLTSSCFEMAGKGGLGIFLDLDKVPLREPDLTPFEIMLSESQERMVLVAHRGKEEALEKIFRRWELEITQIGEITSDGLATIRFAGETVAQIPLRPLTEEAPEYRRPVCPPADLSERQRAPEVPEISDSGAALRTLLSTPELGDKSWVWHQYDFTVRGNTILGPGGDAALLRLKGTPLGLAMTSDVNPVYCWLDPRVGGAQAVAEAARNLACVGAEPLGLTDCLNFGNPENREIAWQFRECVGGMAEACRALSIPVVSGNVSFYNETEGASVHPTPTVGMVGVLPDVSIHPTSFFQMAGDRVLLLGEDKDEFGGSAYLRLLYHVEQGRPPAVDLEAEARLTALLRHGSRAGWLRTATDVSDGGLALTLAEATFAQGLGARLDVEGGPRTLFSETQARAVVAVAPEAADSVLRLAEELSVPCSDIGVVGGDRLIVSTGGEGFDVEVEELHREWHNALPRALDL